MPLLPPPAWRTVLYMLYIALNGTVLAACGAASDGDTAAARTAPTVSFPSTLSTTPPILTEDDPAKAAPRWEQLAVLTGDGPMDLGAIAIAPHAIQWRVKWGCEAATLLITTTPPPIPTRPAPLVESVCPGSGEGFGRQMGELHVNVRASGPWKATFEQQVDTPLDEPPLAEMAEAEVLRQGEFYNVDKTGKGTVILYRLPEGRRALRFEPGFEVFNDPDLVVWLSSVPNPRTAKEMAEGPHVQIAALKSTRGSQNYIVPDDLPIREIRSVGLYCVPVPSIYIAASLS